MFSLCKMMENLLLEVQVTVPRLLCVVTHSHNFPQDHIPVLRSHWSVLSHVIMFRALIGPAQPARTDSLVGVKVSVDEHFLQVYKHKPRPRPQRR